LKMSGRESRKGKDTKPQSAVAAAAKLGRIPKTAKPKTTEPGDGATNGGSGGGASALPEPRPVSHQEVRREKRIRSHSAARLPLGKKVKEESNRPRSSTITKREGFDPLGEAMPLGNKIPEHIVKSPPRIPPRAPSPATSISTVSDADTVIGHDSDDDLAGLQLAMLDIEERRAKFERALLDGDEQAYALASTEEEMKRAKDALHQVGVWSPFISSVFSF
jgi:hypothetical protein